MLNSIKFLVRLLALALLAGSLSRCSDQVEFYSQMAPEQAARLVTSSPVLDFGRQSIRTLNAVTITLVNQGQLPARNIVAAIPKGPFGFKGGSYPGTGGTCGSKIDSTCTLVLVYQPDQVIKDSAALELQYCDQADDLSIKTFSLSLTGEGSNVASLRISLDGINTDVTSSSLGSLALGSTVEKTYHVLYGGAFPATGVSFSTVSAPFKIVSTTCGSEISADCTFTLQYSAAVLGTQSQLIKIEYNNSAAPDESLHTVSAAAVTSTSPAVLSLSGGSFSNTMPGTPSYSTVTVSYRGTLPATQVVGSVKDGTPFSFKGGTFPGTGGSCGTTITTDCTVVLAFIPSSASPFSGTFGLSYYDGQKIQSTSLSLLANGVNPATLSITPVTTTSFGSVSLNEPTTLGFYLSSASNSINASSISFTSLNAPFQVDTGSCPTTLTSDSSCIFHIIFTPRTLGTWNQTVSVSYFNGDAQTSISISVNGSSTNTSVVELSPSALNFGSVTIGTTKSLSVSVSVFGASPAIITSASTLSAPFSITSGWGGSSGWGLANGTTLTFLFAPSTVGSVSSTFQFSYADGNGHNVAVTLTLQGVGQNPGTLAFVDGTAHDFGRVPVGTSSTYTFQIQGSSSAVTQVAVSAPGGSFSLTQNGCPSSVGASGCSVSVAFQPTAAGAAGSQPLTISYNDGAGNKSISITLSGTGYLAAHLAVSQPWNVRAVVGTTQSFSVTVLNNGTLSATSLQLGALSGAFSASQSTCSGSLAPNQSCTLNVTFKPSTPGQAKSLFNVTYYDGVESTQASLNLSATGTVPISVVTNGDHSCAITEIGQVKCWGRNNYGQLGLGDTEDRGVQGGQMGSALPDVSLGTNRYAKSLTLGFFHTCALLDNGGVKCWGWNIYGQLGLGISSQSIGTSAGEMGDALPFVNLGTSQTAIAIAAGYSHTCAVLSTGNVKCWGFNASGQLGLGDTVSRGTSPGDMGDSLPTVDLAGVKALQLSANAGHTCAVLESHQAKCWGDNFYGQLGQGGPQSYGSAPGTMGTALPAIAVGTGRTVQSLVTGGGFSCALLDNGSIKCWGRNDKVGNLGWLWCQNAQGAAGLCSQTGFDLTLLGYGRSPGQMGDSLPSVLLGDHPAIALSAGTGSVCALLDNNLVKCWGENDYGQLDLGSTTPVGADSSEMGNSLPTIALGTGRTVKQISVGNLQACAVLDDNSIKCWGNNQYGELGLGDTALRGDAPSRTGDGLTPVAL